MEDNALGIERDFPKIGLPQIELRAPELSTDRIIEVFEHANNSFSRYFGREFQPGHVKKIRVLEHSGTTPIKSPFFNIPDLESGSWTAKRGELTVATSYGPSYPDIVTFAPIPNWMRVTFHELGHAYLSQITGNTNVENSTHVLALEAAAELGRVVAEHSGDEQEIIDSFEIVLRKIPQFNRLFSAEEVKKSRRYYDKRFYDAAVLNYVFKTYDLQTMIDLIINCHPDLKGLELKFRSIKTKTSPQILVRQRRQDFEDWVQNRFGKTPEELSKEAIDWYKKRFSDRTVYDILPLINQQDQKLRPVV